MTEPPNVTPLPWDINERLDSALEVHRPVTDCPRDRFTRLGASALTIAELLSLLVGATDSKAVSITVGQELLTLVGGSLRQLACTPADALTVVPRVGPARAIQILSAFELARRWIGEHYSERPLMTSPDDIVNHFAPKLRDLSVEEMHLGVLDPHFRLDRAIRLSTGVIDHVAVDARQVFRHSLGGHASSIVLVHNHPTDSPAPSKEDQLLTNRVAVVGRFLGVPLYDHIIIARERYCSFRQEGWLKDTDTFR